MTRTSSWILTLCFLSLGGCGAPADKAADETAGGSADAMTAGESAVSADGVTTYSARAFYDTTTYMLPPVQGYAFSPGDDTLLITSDADGVFNAYALPLDGGTPEQLTASDDNAVFALSWFPADGRMLFTHDEGGNELNHVFVRETDGSRRDLTPGDDLKAQFAGWARDGRAFYMLTTERDPQLFDLYRYDADGYAREMVYQNPGYQLSALSDDGRWLALGKPRTSADADIYLVDLVADAPEPVLITPHDGNVSYAAVTFTPDNARLVFATDEHGEFIQHWTYDLTSGETAPLVQADWDVLYTAYSHTGRYRASGINADARTEVTLTDTRTEDPVRLPALPPGDLGSLRFSANDGKLALMVDSDVSPSDIYLLDLSADTSRRLTDALNPDIDRDDLVTGEVVRYASFDDLRIPAILYRPHQASAAHPVPALVWVHGGPGGQSRLGYNPAIQHLVNHGYAILAANNRGSSGYGKTFFHMDDRRHGEVDLQDIVRGRGYLESLDWVDGGRIGIIGGSYGGYMVAAALTFEPHVFDAGIDIFGVTNWVRTLSSIPPWWGAARDGLYDEMGDPATDQERLRRISPLFHAENIVRPLLVVQGANDPRVLQVESDELVARVRKNGVPVEYVVFPDEGHGFRRRENRIAASEAYLDFLDSHLKAPSP